MVLKGAGSGTAAARAFILGALLMTPLKWQQIRSKLSGLESCEMKPQEMTKYQQGVQGAEDTAVVQLT